MTKRNQAPFKQHWIIFGVCHNFYCREKLLSPRFGHLCILSLFCGGWQEHSTYSYVSANPERCQEQTDQRKMCACVPECQLQLFGDPVLVLEPTEIKRNSPRSDPFPLKSIGSDRCVVHSVCTSSVSSMRFVMGDVSCARRKRSAQKRIVPLKSCRDTRCKALCCDRNRTPRFIPVLCCKADPPLLQQSKPLLSRGLVSQTQTTSGWHHEQSSSQLGCPVFAARYRLSDQNPRTGYWSRSDGTCLCVMPKLDTKANLPFLRLNITDSFC